MTVVGADIWTLFRTAFNRLKETNTLAWDQRRQSRKGILTEVPNIDLRKNRQGIP